jgi:hypothetical protein
MAKSKIFRTTKKAKPGKPAAVLRDVKLPPRKEQKPTGVQVYRLAALQSSIMPGELTLLPGQYRDLVEAGWAELGVELPRRIQYTRCMWTSHSMSHGQMVRRTIAGDNIVNDLRSRRLLGSSFKQIEKIAPIPTG